MRLYECANRKKRGRGAESRFLLGEENKEKTCSYQLGSVQLNSYDCCIFFVLRGEDIRSWHPAWPKRCTRVGSLVTGKVIHSWLIGRNKVSRLEV